MSDDYISLFSHSDFVQAIPTGNPSDSFLGHLPFTLTLRPDAIPLQARITDSDAPFHEGDATRALAAPVTLNGQTWPAGTRISPAFGLSVPGPCEDLRCFGAGTRIATPDGAILVEDLHQGQLVQTLDNGLQPLRAVLSTTVLAQDGFAPVVVPAGTCGNERDLTLSPQHRILFNGARAALLFGESEVLVAARHLVDVEMARRRPGGRITYFHLVFDRHEIIFSEGAATESFLPGAEAGIPAARREEFGGLFDSASEPARLCLQADEASLLLAA